MKKILNIVSFIVLLSFNLKAQNVINPTNEKEEITILRAVGDDSTVSDKKGKVYQVVGQQPSFPGGMRALSYYLANNVKYPIDAAKNKVEGRVLVTFIEHDGSISNVNVTNSVYPIG